MASEYDWRTKDELRARIKELEAERGAVYRREQAEQHKAMKARIQELEAQAVDAGQKWMRAEKELTRLREALRKIQNELKDPAFDLHTAMTIGHIARQALEEKP